jgi:hypothetical protein
MKELELLQECGIFFVFVIFLGIFFLKILKGHSESVYRRMTNPKRKRTNNDLQNIKIKKE